MDHTLEQLEEAKGLLEAKLRQARGDSEYLSTELPRLIAGNALGVTTTGEIEEVRLQLAGAKQTLDEIPAAIVKINAWTVQAREKGAEDDRIAEAAGSLREYFEVRRQIIETPDLAGKRISGRLHGLALQLDRSEARSPFTSEYEALIIAAKEYIYRKQEQPFTFAIQIPETSAP